MISPEFINECITGKEGAIHSLVRGYQRGVFQIALTVLDNGAAPVSEAAYQAEAATRDTIIIAVDRLGQYREDQPFTTWLYRIAIKTSQKRAKRWRLIRRVQGVASIAGR